MDIVRITFNRSSVCMGDDCQSHLQAFTLEGSILVSELLRMAEKYVPNMRGTVWAVSSDNGVCGYLITDSNGVTAIEQCAEDQPLSEAGITELFCRYYCSSDFTWYDTSDKLREKPSECAALLEKVKRSVEG